MTPPHQPEHAVAHHKLLIVDDEEKCCSMLEQYFSLKGYDVRAMQRGQDALEFAETFHPEVVLLDIMMPGMNGIEALHALKQLNPAPKVVILSAIDEEEAVRGTLALGADIFVCKPANLSQLGDIVNGFCSPPSRQ